MGGRARRVVATLLRISGVSWVLRTAEHLVWGGRYRASFLHWLVLKQSNSSFRRDWWWRPPDDLPHYVDQRIGALHSILGGDDPLCMQRGVFAAQVLRPDDVVLDIGCGDGFYSRQFFAKRCATVDALDVEASAIAHASIQRPRRPNVNFLVSDAVADPFPRSAYDIVVWDGALGHFSPDVLGDVLSKIAAVLAPGGAFVGSESLGVEGHDHLQFFADTEALRIILARHFPFVLLSEQSYLTHTGLERREAYWRCALDDNRLRAGSWQ
jgi:SAM-dependent methyltransferase